MLPKPQRQIACNELILPEGQTKTLCVISLEQGYVVRVHPLEKEEPQTEWLQGKIELKKQNNGLRAYYKGKLLT
jgi:hypothetical protein